ncbi:hypothetical protein KFV02_00295 [Desulfohalobiaceae bacterium Ax17]|uniref:hypothetical protein n=1 Tax=Desulfovulcanus ferrireducens TaxID=2831190 RepID=UPI00207BC470|nr:hypothetical protein [Desulfovulcanus ferrireducens]MBT8762372.1 hypothetical protein [Desulfovulcanus ferrireducens]
MKTIFFTLVLFLVISSLDTFARTNTLMDKQYIFTNVNVVLSNNHLVLGGRVSGGPYCKTLKAKFIVQNSHGETRVITTYIEDVGRGGQIVSGRVREYGKNAESWDALQVSTYCIQ